MRRTLVTGRRIAVVNQHLRRGVDHTDFLQVAGTAGGTGKTEEHIRVAGKIQSGEVPIHNSHKRAIKAVLKLVGYRIPIQ